MVIRLLYIMVIRIILRSNIRQEAIKVAEAKFLKSEFLKCLYVQLSHQN